VQLAQWGRLVRKVFLAQREQQVLKAFQALLGHQESLGKLVPLERRAIKVIQGQQDQLGLLVQLVLVACQEAVAEVEDQGVLQVQLEREVEEEAAQALRVRRVPQGQLDRHKLDLRDQLEVQAQLESQGILAPQENAQLVLLAQQERLVALDQLERTRQFQVRQVRLAKLALQELRDPKEQLEQQVQLVILEHRVLKERRAIQGLKGQSVTQGILVIQELKDRSVILVPILLYQGRPVILALKALKEPPELQDIQVHKERKAQLGIQERKE
jgi:hypothetical protein